jgi:hypothetical protein
VMPDRQGDVGLNLTLHRGLYIEGRVVIPDGGAPFLAIHAATERFALLTQGSEVVDGKFRLGPLVPGLYTVSVYTLVERGPVSYADPSPVQIRSGTTDVEFVLRRGGAVMLRAVDATTREVVDSQFTLSRLGGAGVHRVSGRGASAGFEANGLEPGAYCALALAPDGRVGLLQELVVGTAESSEATIAIAPGGVLVVRRPDDGGLRDLHVMCGDGVVDLQHLEHGLDFRSTLPPGHYRVGIVSRDRSAVPTQRVERFDSVHEVDVRAGEETILELTP